MPEMPAAARAVGFHPRHSMAAVGRRGDRAVDGAVEARPSGAALELGVRREERLPAGAADEHAVTLLAVQRAGAGALCPVLPQHVKLLGGQGLAPLLVSFLYHPRNLPPR